MAAETGVESRWKMWSSSSRLIAAKTESPFSASVVQRMITPTVVGGKATGSRRSPVTVAVSKIAEEARSAVTVEPDSEPGEAGFGDDIVECGQSSPSGCCEVQHEGQVLVKVLGRRSKLGSRCK